MTHIHEFHGLSHIDDIVRILKCYDEGSEWPKQSGISYTQHFLPHAFANQWRLWQQSKAIWDCFRETRQKAGMGPLKELSMQAFTQVIGCLLVDLSKRDSDELMLENDNILDAIENTAYIHQDLYFD